MTESNGRPTEYETVTLPTELKGQMAPVEGLEPSTIGFGDRNSTN